MRMQATIQVPEMLLASERKHNAEMRKCLREELEHHKAETIPLHFQPGNAQRYGHAARSPRYRTMKAKYYNSTVDLVKRGETKRAVRSTAGSITIGGSAAADTIRGRLRFRLPFGGGTGRQMDEAAWQRLEKALNQTNDPRKRAQIKAALAGRRSNRGRAGVTPAQMVKEMQTITREEADAMTRRLGERYVARIKAMKRPRLITGKTLPRI